MGTYIQPIYNEAYYVIGDAPSRKVSRLAVTIEKGTVIDRLTRPYKRYYDDDLSLAFGVGVVAACLGAFIGVIVYILSTSSAGWATFWVIASLGALIGVVYPVLVLLYYFVGKAIRANIKLKGDSSFQRQLAAQPNVVHLTSDVIRPAVAALGDKYWFQANAVEYGKAIDDFLTDSRIVGLEDRMSRASKGTETYRLAESELKRIAAGTVREFVHAREADKAKERAVAREVNDQLLREYLETDILTIVTPGDVPRRASDELEELR